MAAIDLKKCTIAIQDGTSTPNSITLKVGEGNLTYTIGRNIDYVLDRGTIATGTVREGDEIPCAVSLDIVYEFYTSDDAGGEAVTPAEALQKIGAASTWVTTGSDICEPYAVDIIVTYAPNCSPTKNEGYVFSEFRYESLDFDIRAGTLSASGNCNEIRPTVTRVAPS